MKYLQVGSLSEFLGALELLRASLQRRKTLIVLEGLSVLLHGQKVRSCQSPPFYPLGLVNHCE